MSWYTTRAIYELVSIDGSREGNKKRFSANHRVELNLFCITLQSQCQH